MTCRAAGCKESKESKHLGPGRAGSPCMMIAPTTHRNTCMYKCKWLIPQPLAALQELLYSTCAICKRSLNNWVAVFSSVEASHQQQAGHTDQGRGVHAHQHHTPPQPAKATTCTSAPDTAQCRCKQDTIPTYICASSNMRCCIRHHALLQQARSHIRPNCM